MLRSIGIQEPVEAVLEGRKLVVPASPFSPNLPVWEPKWQQIMDMALEQMDRRYDMVQQYDLQTLWVEFLSRVSPDHTPKISKVEGWAAALEYLTAKMHRRAISYQELSHRYEVSVTTISKNVKIIDDACGLREKMETIFSKFSSFDNKAK